MCNRPRMIDSDTTENFPRGWRGSRDGSAFSTSSIKRHCAGVPKPAMLRKDLTAFKGTTSLAAERTQLYKGQRFTGCGKTATGNGTGFSPYINFSEMNGALQAAEKLAVLKGHG